MQPRATTIPLLSTINRDWRTVSADICDQGCDSEALLQPRFMLKNAPPVESQLAGMPFSFGERTGPWMMAWCLSHRTACTRIGIRRYARFFSWGVSYRWPPACKAAHTMLYCTTLEERKCLKRGGML